MALHVCRFGSHRGPYRTPLPHPLQVLQELALQSWLGNNISLPGLALTS